MNLAEHWRTRWPLVQAPMAGVQGAALANAAAQGGALGSLPCAMLDAAGLQREWAALRPAVPGQAFNLNFFCHRPPTPDAAREAAWAALLAPYREALGLPADATGTAAQRQPFSRATVELLDALRPRVLSFHFGLPEPDLLAQVKAWGTQVMASATTVAEARWLHAHGADVVIAQGLEAGGHRGMFLDQNLDGQMGLMALLPQVLRAVPCPVLAAGGVADAAGVRAAMALGAAGVQVGTAYLLCPEASTTAVHQAALQSPAAADTTLTTLFSGRPARGIVNRLMRELGPMNPAAPAFPLASAALAPLRAAAEAQGSGDFSPLWCGQNASGCKPVPAAQLTAELAAGFGG